MLTKISLGATLLLAALIPSATAVDITRNPELVAQLKAAATQLDRRALLNSSSDWLFDFTAQPYYTFSPGGVINANVATFPAAVGNGMTMAMLNLGPCSMLPPHYHPRASNFVVAIAGTTKTYMIEENGAPAIEQILTPGKMTIFPQASVHTMVNLGCENSQLISALNNEDQGTQNLFASLLAIPDPDLVNAAAGYDDFYTSAFAAQLNKLDPIGTGANYGTKQCLARCAALNGTASAANGTASSSSTGYGSYSKA